MSERFTRLLARVRSIANRFRPGRDSAALDSADAESIPAANRVCSICGTPVEGDTDRCPLCGSSDLADPADRESTVTAETEPALDPTKARRSAVPDDDAVDRLSALRDAGTDLLVLHRERWEPLDDEGDRAGYRMQLQDGGSVQVESKGELRAALLREYGRSDDSSAGRQPK